MAVSPAPLAGGRELRQGVAPLRAGEGIHFWLRRLHSLSGIVPIGAFLAEHFISNAFATNGPGPYAEQVKFLTGLPFVQWIEAIFIWIPLAFHATYGFFIWYRGEINVGSYPWTGNWMYGAQRWTGAIAFLYMGWHTYTMRFSGVHLIGGSQFAFSKVQHQLLNPWAVAFYVAGIIAASWHFAYGIWLFAAKWGIIVGERARRWAAGACFLLAVVFIIVGLYTVRAFFDPAWQNEWQTLPGETSVVRTVPPAVAAKER